MRFYYVVVSRDACVYLVLLIVLNQIIVVSLHYLIFCLFWVNSPLPHSFSRVGQIFKFPIVPLVSPVCRLCVCEEVDEVERVLGGGLSPSGPIEEQPDQGSAPIVLHRGV